MKKVLELIKKIAITTCIIFFLATFLFDVFYYGTITEQFNKLQQNKEELVSEFGNQEETIEKQMQEFKEKQGEDYPIIAMLQYTQYIVGAETIIYMNVRIAIYSLGFGVIVETFKFIIKIMKTRKNGEKNG